MIFRVLFPALVLFAAGARAQYRFDSWTTENGLPQNSVYALAQTPDGYLWMTTLDGLVRFDGIRFTVFNKMNSPGLPSNRFTNLLADSDGTVWISTEENGLVRYQGGEFRNFTTADGLSSNEIYQIQRESADRLLLTGNKGLIGFGGGVFTAEPETDFRNYRIYIGPSGARWQLDADGLRVRRGAREERYPLPFDPKAVTANRTFNYLAYVPLLEAADGALWMAAAGRLFRLRNGAFEAFDRSLGMPASRIRSLAQDRAGAIWLATENRGVCRFDGQRFACFGKKDGLSSENTYNLFIDREGTLWVTTIDGGLNRVTPRAVSSLSVGEGLLDKNVYPILEAAPGDVWIGTTSALSHYEKGRITNYTRRNGLLYEIVQSLFLDRDRRLWIGSNGGVEYLENGRFVDFTSRLGLQLGDRNFVDIHQDRNGVFWFATREELFRYENGRATRLTTSDGLLSNDVQSIYEAHDGALWFSFWGGVSRFKDGVFTNYTEAGGLASGNVRAIYEDPEDGAFWFGTYDGGLSRLKDGRFTNYSTRNGLFSNGVFQILPDDRGNFWMSANQGIYRVSREQLRDFADGKIPSVTAASYGRSDGMLTVECNGGRSPAGIKTSDGRLWFPTQDGVAIIAPDNIPFNPLPPPVLIETIGLDGAERPVPAEKIEIAPGQRNLEIAYTAASFIKPEQIRFRYRLEGLDDGWTESGGRRTAFYPYLPPGKYTFRVIAANSDGVWNETGAALEIVVQPAFYQTWWFFGLAAAGLGFLAFFVFRRRLNASRRRQLAQEEFSRRLINAHETERRRIAAELHDSIGQSLAMIKNGAVFGAQTITDLDGAREALAEISTQSAQAIGEVREIAYNLRPFMLDRLGLTRALRALLNKVADASPFTLKSEIEEIDGIFETEAEISIYRIVQESLNNILKHSGAERVFVAVANRPPAVAIRITDDGRGFDVAATTESKARGGFGLLGMTERVRMLGGTFRIESAPGAGTLIEIEIWKQQSGS
ncbi:MAG: hypothetical protein JSS81_29545 [Acidobacteria bacterium]|nr:hypothetical protein [Acidobacteriota bacterium]